MFNTPIKKNGGYTDRLLQTAGIGDTSQRSTVHFSSTRNSFIKTEYGVQMCQGVFSVQCFPSYIFLS